MILLGCDTKVMGSEFNRIDANSTGFVVITQMKNVESEGFDEILVENFYRICLELVLYTFNS